MKKSQHIKIVAASVTTSALVFGVSLMLASQSAQAGSDCKYRITGTDPANISVVPTGITGMMSCSDKQFDELIAKLADGMKKRDLAQVNIKLANLNDFPALRLGLAKALSQNGDWDSKRGRPMNSSNTEVVNAQLSQLLAASFQKHGVNVSTVKVDRLSIEKAENQKIKDLEGRFPLAGRLNLTVSKQ